MFHVIVNANLIVRHVIQIKNGIMINFNLSVKSTALAKETIDTILANIFVRIVDI